MPQIYFKIPKIPFQNFSYFISFNSQIRSYKKEEKFMFRIVIYHFHQNSNLILENFIQIQNLTPNYFFFQSYLKAILKILLRSYFKTQNSNYSSFQLLTFYSIDKVR